MADSALDSQLESYETIILTNKKASLVGGSIYATEGLQAYTVGNPSEVKTQIQVGVKRELLKDIFEANKKKTELEDMIEKINAGLKQYDDYVAEHGKDAGQEERRVTLFRTRMMKQAELATLEKETNRIKDIVSRGRGATVQVVQDVYPGASITIDQYVSTIKTKQTSVKFLLHEDSVVMLSLGGIRKL
jgi:hypothetical protein